MPLLHFIVSTSKVLALVLEDKERDGLGHQRKKMILLLSFTERPLQGSGGRRSLSERRCGRRAHVFALLAPFSSG